MGNQDRGRDSFRDRPKRGRFRETGNREEGAERQTTERKEQRDRLQRGRYRETGHGEEGGE